jgi:hypothetical protein
MSTPKPWKVVDHASARKGYLVIEGPNGEKIAEVFPFAGVGGVGIEEARDNARLIVSLVNDDPVT